MTNFMKKIPLALMAVLITTFALSAQVQAAGGKKTDVTFKNNTDFDIDITLLDWAGSFWPNFGTSTVPAHTEVSGLLKTLADYGSTYFTFTATINAPSDAEHGETCLLTFTINNSTNVLAHVLKAATNGGDCEVTHNVNNPSPLYAHHEAGWQMN